MRKAAEAIAEHGDADPDGAGRRPGADLDPGQGARLRSADDETAGDAKAGELWTPGS